MRLLPRLLCLLLLSTSAIVNALHADEAGLTDFVLKSAGHGDVGVRYAATVDKVWVTSQSNEYPGAIIDLENDSIGSSIRHYYDRHCSIAGRNVTTGAVLGGSMHVVVIMIPYMIIMVDSSPGMRRW